MTNCLFPQSPLGMDLPLPPRPAARPDREDTSASARPHRPATGPVRAGLALRVLPGPGGRPQTAEHVEVLRLESVEALDDREEGQRSRL